MRWLRGAFFLGLSLGLFFLMNPVIAQKKTLKKLIDSTKELAKVYKLQAKKSVDSFKRVEKHKLDSIRIKNNPDTIPFQKNYRLGIDLSKPVQSAFNSTQTDLEFSMDYHARERIFYAGEIGFESLRYNVNKYYNYSSTGEYLKLGFDYGIFKVTRRKDNNIIYTGVRLGVGNVAFKADSINIAEGYFGNTNSAAIKGNGTSYWLEFVFGTKVELFPKFFIGWSIRLDSQLKDLTKGANYPVRIPGYGNSSNSQAFNYTYSIFYSF